VRVNGLFAGPGSPAGYAADFRSRRAEVAGSWPSTGRSAGAGRRYVGSLAPGAEVGGNAGWQDMPYAVQALKRKDGEYLILVEEDWRGKNLLYRWRPDDKGRPPNK
jgi:hypothetical protein